MIIFASFIIALSVFLLNWLDKFYGANKKFEEIPGPNGIPLLGNIEDMFCSPEKAWRRSRMRALKYFPIYRMKIFNRKIINILDPVDVEAILGSNNCKGDVYKISKVWLGNGLLLTEGDTWRRSRKLLTKNFHYGALDNYLESFRNGVAGLNKALEQEIGKPSDLSNFLNEHTLLVACENLYGERLDENARHLLVEAIQTMCRITFYKLVIPLLLVFYKYTWFKTRENEALKVFSDFATHALQKYKDSDSTENGKESNLLDILVKNYDEQGIRDEINTFLFAGQDTTSTALYFILYVLANHPEYQDEILREMVQTAEHENLTYGEINQMNFLDRFIKECLRMYPPVYFIARCLNEDVSTPSGYTIPAGHWIFIHIFDIHRNPEIYPNPDVFDPERFLLENVRKRHPYSFIPFSAGPRNCIAQKFAMLEIKTTICGLLRKYRVEAVGSLQDITLIPDLLLKTKDSMKVKLTPREQK